MGDVHNGDRQARVIGNSPVDCVENPLQKRVVLLQKLRSAMGNRDARYLLEGIVEFDDSYFGGTKPGGKRGKRFAMLRGARGTAGRVHDWRKRPTRADGDAPLVSALK